MYYYLSGSYPSTNVIADGVAFSITNTGTNTSTKCCSFICA